MTEDINDSIQRKGKTIQEKKYNERKLSEVK